ncbi:MAG: restriction endonuclease [Planctomycetota bacterium]|nr:MAG: restriction endonuclease [Planctomycetota bacterium]
MAIPDFQSIMLPLLELLQDGKPRTTRQCIEALADRFELTREERSELLPSGQQPVFDNRVGWARTYLKKAGLIDSPRRGVLQISQRGRAVLAERPNAIDIPCLMRFEEFREFRTRQQPGEERRAEPSPPLERADPLEQMERAYSELRTALVEELLRELRGVSPAFFERLVLQILLKMGYGGGLEQAATLVARTGDEGIDGTIHEDKLGLDVIYIQAKCWTNPVGRPEVQKFVGALHGRRARKGVFITTSSFTQEAREYVQHLDPKVALIDGETLARLMIEHNVGVSVKATYELKGIDRDFFEDTG